jgi:DNA-directed RNA polymerase subunit RPC12/RpoP
VKTIEEFNAGITAFDRRFFTVLGVGFILLVLGFFGVGMPFEKALREYLARRLDGATAERLAALFVLGVGLPGTIISLGGLFLTFRQAKRDRRIICPYCGKLLVEHRFLVVTTRNCCRCGRRVLSEPEERDALRSERRKTSDEVRAGTSAYNARFIIAIVACVLTAVLGSGLLSFYAVTLQQFLTQKYDAVTTEILIIVLQACAILPGLGILLGGIMLNERRVKRDDRILCPHCHKVLVGIQGIVDATRNCGFCGRRVLADPVGVGT